MSKKALTILIIVGIIAIGAGVYLAWQRYSKPLATLPQNLNQQNYNNQVNLPASNVTSKLNILSKSDAVVYWVGNSSTSTTQDVFYISSNGNLNQISDGKEEVISNENPGTIEFAKTLAVDKKVLVVFKKTSLIPEIFDITKKLWIRFINGNEVVASIDVSPDGKKVAYIAENNKGGEDLFTYDLSNNKAKAVKIMTLNIKDFSLNWVDDNSLIFTPKPAFNYSAEAWKLDLQTKTLSKITEGRGLMFNWAKLGGVGLEFSSSQDRNYRLTLIDDSGAARGDFKFITLPDKCFISSPQQIYCAISRDQSIFSTNEIFPDDYLKRAAYFKDGIYQVDIGQNKFQALFEAESPLIDATNLTLDGNRILFINRYDNKLYSLEI